jgi:hypothetical protein
MSAVGGDGRGEAMERGQTKLTLVVTGSDRHDC